MKHPPYPRQPVLTEQYSVGQEIPFRTEAVAAVAVASAEKALESQEAQSPFMEQIHERAHKTTAVMAQLLSRTNAYLHWGINE